MTTVSHEIVLSLIGQVKGSVLFPSLVFRTSPAK